MKTRPILFSGTMIRALLEGRKTQTRRIVKPQPEWGWWEIHEPWHASAFSVCGKDYVCPYGQPGDFLWVRETWGMKVGHHIPLFTCQQQQPDRHDPVYRAGRRVLASENRPKNGSDEDWPVTISNDFETPSDGKWHPSIHMPRWASRLRLRITDVRVQQLQDISDDDMRAEGCEDDPATDTPLIFDWRRIWESIGNDWNANPWVWGISFDVIHENVDKVVI